MWADEFTVTNIEVSNELEISRQQLDRMRNLLIQKKLITYSKGNGSKSGVYHMNSFQQKAFVSNNVTQDVTQRVTQYETQTVTQDVTTPIKTINNKQDYISVISSQDNNNYNSYGNDSTGMTEYNNYRDMICENISYHWYAEHQRFDIETIDEIVSIMVDCICSETDYIKINKQRIPREVVKSQFLKINSEHIEFILDALRTKADIISNIKQYTITVIYNAAITMNLRQETGG